MRFQGWDMATAHALPWDDKYQWENFRRTAHEIKKSFEFGPDIGINAGNVDTLKWRHWFIIFSVYYALKFSEISHKNSNTLTNLVECGVADGMSAFFILHELSGLKNAYPFKLHLYDSWAPMRKEGLLPQELLHEGHYDNLDLERSKRNLSQFLENIVIHQGYIPESLTADSKSPADSIIFVHIDLNSAQPTLAALNFFYPKIVKGGVILFDDYGWREYKDTKEIVDRFFSDKSGIFLKMPTGQAMYIVK
jgi:hypothetical protein